MHVRLRPPSLNISAWSSKGLLLVQIGVKASPQNRLAVPKNQKKAVPSYKDGIDSNQTVVVSFSVHGGYRNVSL
ncbi:hypothetical protein PL10110_280020 [Planktothrix agardhii]|nr:hypothetical protein PL10110_280020 [Planktothrix agardhii]